jgi:hypothetical protein
MTEKNLCKCCKKNLDKIEFIFENKEYKTCNICRDMMSKRRRKNICEICGINASFNVECEQTGIRCNTHKIIGMIDVKHKKCVVCCKKRPIFNIEGELKALYCGDCKEVGMVDTRNNKCIKCKVKQPNFNIESETKAMYCGDCKEVGMVNIKNHKCIKCKVKQPAFNIEGELKALYCGDCKEVGMVNIKNRKCIKCKVKHPAFNIESETKAMYCGDCKEVGMVNIKNPKCLKCKVKHPAFNIEGATKAVYCGDCKKVGMVDIIHPKCIKCKVKRPVFNIEGKIKALYCGDCKEVGMVDIKNPKCIKCKVKRPNFNIEGETKALYCSDCKEVGMVNVKNKKCVICKKKEPNFNKEGETKPIHCGDCKEVGMVDVKTRKCHCGICASFGYINQPKTHCTRHKLTLMFRNTKTKCQECEEVAEYGLTEPIHCFIHQKENDLCLLGKKCKQCLRENELCNKDGLCLTYCRPTEIDLNVKKIIKKKEAMVLAYVDNNFKTEVKPIDNRVIDNCCVKNLPDRLYYFGTYYIVLEVDENQHKYYNNGCPFSQKEQEQRRMIQIVEALNMGTVPVIFLRFNPDNFRVGGKLIKINMAKRLEVLVKWLKYYSKYEVKNFNDSIINIKYLFYDNYDETNLEFENIKN